MLGDSLDTDNIEATYDQGVLTLSIPVAEGAKPRKVTVTSGAKPEAIETSSASGDAGSATP
jgi:HSP20 family protein